MYFVWESHRKREAGLWLLGVLQSGRAFPISLAKTRNQYVATDTKTFFKHKHTDGCNFIKRHYSFVQLVVNDMNASKLSDNQLVSE